MPTNVPKRGSIKALDEATAMLGIVGKHILNDILLWSSCIPQKKDNAKNRSGDGVFQTRFESDRHRAASQHAHAICCVGKCTAVNRNELKVSFHHSQAYGQRLAYLAATFSMQAKVADTQKVKIGQTDLIWHRGQNFSRRAMDADQDEQDHRLVVRNALQQRLMKRSAL